MADRPIIFSAPQIRAFLDGRKTQTRRLAWREKKVLQNRGLGPQELTVVDYATYWQKVHPDDRLWVRETVDLTGSVLRYKASNPPAYIRWTPSIHMPRWASRLTLTVTATKIERVQEISGSDVEAEGTIDRGHDWDCLFIEPTENPDGPSCKCGQNSYQKTFSRFWDSLHGEGSWNANPYVVALTFTVNRRNIDAMERE